MVDQTDLRLPLTPAKIGRAVGVIVERAFPSPRQEECMRVGEMERALTALCGEAVQVAYDDAARELAPLHADRDRLIRELAEVKAKLHRVQMVQCWTNEDGKRFVFVTDLQDALAVPRDDREVSRG